MKRLSPIRMFVAGVAAAMCLATPSFAASDYLLEIDGIKGESTDEMHRDAIDFLAFSFDFNTVRTARAGAAGGGAGKVSMSDISIMKQLDKASPLLMLACASGKHIPKAKLFVRKQGSEQQDYYTITLSDVLVSSIAQSGAQGSGRPSESLSLNFTKIEVSYFLPNPTGGAPEEYKFSWDLKTNTK